MSVVSIYLYIIVLPLILGAALRFLLRKRKKSWLFSLLLAVIAAVALLRALFPPVLGSELYALRFVQAISMLIGSLVTGGVLRIKKR